MSLRSSVCLTHLCRANACNVLTPLCHVPSAQTGSPPSLSLAAGAPTSHSVREGATVHMSCLAAGDDAIVSWQRQDRRPMNSRRSTTLNSNALR